MVVQMLQNLTLRNQFNQKINLTKMFVQQQPFKNVQPQKTIQGFPAIYVCGIFRSDTFRVDIYFFGAKISFKSIMSYERLCSRDYLFIKNMVLEDLLFSLLTFILATKKTYFRHCEIGIKALSTKLHLSLDGNVSA